jgi:hypothetical protein
MKQECERIHSPDIPAFEECGALKAPEEPNATFRGCQAKNSYFFS